MRTITKIAIVIFALLIFSQIKPCFGSCNILKNPIQYANPSKLSVGIVAYGFYNKSGEYAFQTKEIVGNVTFSNISISKVNSLNKTQCQCVASLQLNVMMKLISKNNSTYVYWLQNMMQIYNISNKTGIQILDNVWNYTQFNASISNKTLSGYGKVMYSNSIGRNFYVYQPNGWAFKFPLNFAITLKPYIEVNAKNNKTIVSFGFKKGPDISGLLDNVTLSIPTNKVYLSIDPYNFTPPNSKGNGGTWYDAEFVFGGPCCLLTSTFNSINANMWLYYNKNNMSYPFQTLNAFGLDTGESAQNLSVTMGSSGATISIGRLNYSKPLILNNH